MKALVLRFIKSDEGQDLIEYVLLGSLISLAVVAAATALGSSLNLWCQSMANWASARAATV